MADDFQPISFDDLTQMLIHHGALASTSEIHGFLVGNLCQRAGESEWLYGVETLLEINLGEIDNLKAILKHLYQQVGTTLEEGQFDFELLLPDSETPLPLIVEGLAEWVNGFLAGLVSQNNSDSDGFISKPQETRELILDLAKISEATATSEGAEDEREFIEICEYVKVAALNIYENFSPEKPKQDKPKVAKLIH